MTRRSPTKALTPPSPPPTGKGPDQPLQQRRRRPHAHPVTAAHGRPPSCPTAPSFTLAHAHIRRPHTHQQRILPHLGARARPLRAGRPRCPAGRLALPQPGQSAVFHVFLLVIAIPVAAVPFIVRQRQQQHRGDKRKSEASAELLTSPSDSSWWPWELRGQESSCRTSLRRRQRRPTSCRCRPLCPAWALSTRRSFR